MCLENLLIKVGESTVSSVGTNWLFGTGATFRKKADIQT